MGSRSLQIALREKTRGLKAAAAVLLPDPPRYKDASDIHVPCRLQFSMTRTVEPEAFR
jgi:hypothetical protein